MKTPVQRIQYYTHKVMEYTGIRPAKRKPDSLRFNRLIAYKSAMNKLLPKSS